MILRALENKDLNQQVLKRRPGWVKGMLCAANLMNEMYSSSVLHPYLVGDCVLAKCNLLKRGRQIRRNPVLVSVVYNHKTNR